MEGVTYNKTISQKDLIKEFAGIDVSKSLQSSDFGGDLSEKQLQYCAKDVIYLHKIKIELEKLKGSQFSNKNKTALAKSSTCINSLKGEPVPQH